MATIGHSIVPVEDENAKKIETEICVVVQEAQAPNTSEIIQVSNAISRSNNLQRTLDLKDATAIVVGIIVGSGIFASPGVVLADLEGNILLFFTVWIGGGILSLFGGLCFAELASMIPSSGASYQYLLVAFGRLPAFLFVWAYFWAIKSGTIAIITLIFSRYITQLIFSMPVDELDDDIRVKIVGVLAIIVLTVVNCINVKGVAWVQNILAMLKLGVMGLTIVLALKLLFWNHELTSLQDNFLNLLQVDQKEGNDMVTTVLLMIPKIGLATIATMWAYDGWMDVTSITEEVKQPEKNIPRSIFLGVVAVVIAYVLVNLSYLAVLPKEVVETSQTIAVDLGNVALGKLGGIIMALGVSIAAVGALNASILTGGRVFYAAARDGLFPISKYVMMTGYFKTPFVALLIQGGWSIVLLLYGDFTRLVEYFGLASYIFYGLTVAGMMWLHHTEPNRDRPFKATPYPLVPLLFIFASTAIVISGLWMSFLPSLAAIAFILLGVPVYYTFFHCGNLVPLFWDILWKKLYMEPQLEKREIEKQETAIPSDIVSLDI